MGKAQESAERTVAMEGGRAASVAAPQREEIGQALERLSRLLIRRGPDPAPEDGARSRAADGEKERIREALGFFGQVAAGWPQIPADALPADGAGFGSTVVVQDVEGGAEETYTLMTGALLDIDAGQVSLASPIGQALLGARPGEVVTVTAPQRTRRLRVISVRTLRDRLETEVP